MEIQTLLIVVAGLLVLAVVLLLVLVLRRPGGSTADAALQQQLESERNGRHSAERLLAGKEAALLQANERISALEAEQVGLREGLAESQRERTQLEANLEL